MMHIDEFREPTRPLFMVNTKPNYGNISECEDTENKLNINLFTKPYIYYQILWKRESGLGDLIIEHYLSGQ